MPESWCFFALRHVRVVGLTLGVTAPFGHTRVRPYGTLGGGTYWHRRYWDEEGGGKPAGSSPGGYLGFGIEMNEKYLALTLEPIRMNIYGDGRFHFNFLMMGLNIFLW